MAASDDISLPANPTKLNKACYFLADHKEMTMHGAMTTRPWEVILYSPPLPYS